MKRRTLKKRAARARRNERKADVWHSGLHFIHAERAWMKAELDKSFPKKRVATDEEANAALVEICSGLKRLAHQFRDEGWLAR